MADKDDKKNQAYYPTPIITNGWYACVEEDNPHLGLTFRKVSRQCIALSHTFNYLPVKAISEDQYDLYQKINKQCNDAEATYRKAVEDYCSRVMSGRGKVDEAEKALKLALEDKDRILNNLKKKSYDEAFITVFESSAGLAGFPLDMQDAAKLFALTRQGKIINFNFTDDGKCMNVRVTRPQSLKAGTLPLSKLIL